MSPQPVIALMWQIKERIHDIRDIIVTFIKFIVGWRLMLESTHFQQFKSVVNNN